jgi:hypothetical protein
MQKVLNDRQEHLLAVLCRHPRGEAPLSNLDGRVLRPLLRRKYVVLMGQQQQQVVVTGAGRIYFESFLKSLAAVQDGDIDGIRLNGRDLASRKNRIAAALDLLQSHLPADAEIKLSTPGDGLDILAYADDVVSALRRYFRSAI